MPEPEEYTLPPGLRVASNMGNNPIKLQPVLIDPSVAIVEGDVPTRQADGSWTPQAASGGGSGGFSVIGPFTVTYEDAGLLDSHTQVELAALATGTLILSAWVIIDVAFAWTGGSGSTAPALLVQFGDAVTGDYETLAAYKPDLVLWPPEAGVTREGQPPELLSAGARLQAPEHAIGLVNTPGHLYAHLSIDATPTMTAGSARVYALVQVPA